MPTLRASLGAVVIAGTAVGSLLVLDGATGSGEPGPPPATRGTTTTAPPPPPTTAPPATPTTTPPTPAPPLPPASGRSPAPEATPAPDPAPPRPAAPPPSPSPSAEPAPPPADPVLRAGADGAAVAALQARLVDLGYWLGEPDGTYGPLTAQAVMAFQKEEGLGRDGVAGPATLAALATADRPAARTDLLDGVEIDLDRQLLLVVADGDVRWALNTSTGAPATPTRPGEFVVGRSIDGVRHAPLGELYRPMYFDGGIAVHGSPSVPGHPASHGCARVADAVMDLLWSSGALRVGTAVAVY